MKPAVLRGFSIGGAACAVCACAAVLSFASVASSSDPTSPVIDANSSEARTPPVIDAASWEIRAPPVIDAPTSASSDAQAPKPDAKGPAAQAHELEESFAKQGIHLDLERHVCWITATVDIRDDLLEYLLVNPKGAAHESVFVTEVVPSVLQTALLALGVERGKNAIWKARTPPPTAEEMRAGIAPYTVDPPEGDGLYMYAAWREKGETYFYRVEDLVRDLETGRSMRRHRWVYLGSRWVKPKQSKEEIFVADYDGNLVNIALFEEGNTLLTAALPECLKQTIWLTNAWLVPERGAQVAFLFTRDRWSSLPSEIESALPEVVETAAAKRDANDGR